MVAASSYHMHICRAASSSSAVAFRGIGMGRGWPCQLGGSASGPSGPATPLSTVLREWRLTSPANRLPIATSSVDPPSRSPAQGHHCQECVLLWHRHDDHEDAEHDKHEAHHVHHTHHVIPAHCQLGSAIAMNHSCQHLLLTDSIPRKALAGAR